MFTILITATIIYIDWSIMLSTACLSDLIIPMFYQMTEYKGIGWDTAQNERPYIIPRQWLVCLINIFIKGNTAVCDNFQRHRSGKFCEFQEIQNETKLQITFGTSL